MSGYQSITTNDKLASTLYFTKFGKDNTFLFIKQIFSVKKQKSDSILTNQTTSKKTKVAEK